MKLTEIEKDISRFIHLLVRQSQRQANSHTGTDVAYPQIYYTFSFTPTHLLFLKSEDRLRNVSDRPSAQFLISVLCLRVLFKLNSDMILIMDSHKKVINNLRRDLKPHFTSAHQYIYCAFVAEYIRHRISFAM